MRKVLRFLKEYFIGSSSDKPFSKKKKRLFSLFTFFLFVFAIGVFLAIFTLKIHNANSRTDDFNKNAAAVCSDLISEAGTSRVEQLDVQNLENSWRMLGISAVRRVDFDADGKNELLVAYFKGGTYYVEIWGSKGSDFINLYKEEANSLKDYPELGSWLTVYNNGGKYYIGRFNENSEENMDLLALHGKEFRADLKCSFDPKNAFYLMNEEIDTAHFETIQFSALTSAKADYQLNTVQDGLMQFKSEKEAIDNLPKTEEQKKASAYAKIIDDKINKYGTPQVSELGSSAYANGVAVVSLVDFNGDGNSELLIISRNRKNFDDTDAFPKYLTEVFNWNGELVKKIFERETTSNYFKSEKNDVFYILQRADGKAKICYNTYAYGEDPDISWKAISTICEMTSLDGFEDTLTAYKRKNYDYISYKINGDTVRKSKFEEAVIDVPYFCGEEDYNKEEFTVSVLKCDASKKADIENLIKNTEEVIKQINKGSAK